MHVYGECNYVGVQALWFDFVSPVAIMVEGSKTSEYSMRVWNYYAPVNWLNAICQTIPNDQIWSKARSKLVVDLCSSVWFFFGKLKVAWKHFTILLLSKSTKYSNHGGFFCANMKDWLYLHASHFGFTKRKIKSAARSVITVHSHRKFYHLWESSVSFHLYIWYRKRL